MIAAMSWTADLAHAFRGLKRAPGFAIIAVLTLGLGIGAETALVSIIDAATSRAAQNSDLHGIYGLERTSPIPKGPPYLSALDVPVDLFRALDARRGSVIAGVAASGCSGSPLVQSGRNAAALVLRCVTAGYLSVFRAQPLVGRWFTDDDERMVRPVAVVSERLWRRWFGSRPGIINQASLRLFRHTFTVVGVLPAEVNSSDIWIPFAAADLIAANAAPFAMADPRGLKVGRYTTTFVRLEAGVPRARLDRIVNDIVTSFGGFGDAHFQVAARELSEVVPTASLARSRVWLLSLSSLILLGACANLANMAYARGLERESEIAVRLSLGASRSHIARLFLAETTVLATAAAVLGGLIAFVALSAFAQAAPELGTRSLVGAVDFTPDYRVALVALGAGVLAAAGVGLMTAWRATRVTHLRLLAAGAASGSAKHDGRLRTILVAVQITGAVVLVIVTGLYLQNGPPIPDTRLAFDTTHVVTGRIAVTVGSVTASARQILDEKVLAAARILPGVESAALASAVPGGTGLATPPLVTLSADDPRDQFANFVPVRIKIGRASITSGFFRALDLPLLRGRDFEPADGEGADLLARRDGMVANSSGSDPIAAGAIMPVAILSETAAAQLYPGQDALGKRVMFGRGLWTAIIGISADPIAGEGFMFVPRGQSDAWTSTLLVFRSTAPGAAIDALGEAVHAIDEDAAIVDAATLDQSMFAAYAPARAVRLTMTITGILALGIALFGVYGVITYFVTSRMREFGIRLALGATPGRIVRLVVDHAIHLVLVGLLVGVFVASVTTRVVESQVFRTMPNGLATWVVVPLLVLVTGVAAGFVPAARAARVDPNVSLRES